MGEPSNFYDVMGLPTPDCRNAALERMREHFDDSMAPWRKADAWWEKFGDRTGIPTYHDVFAGTEGLREWVQEHYPDAVDGARTIRRRRVSRRSTRGGACGRRTIVVRDGGATAWSVTHAQTWAWPSAVW